MKKGVIYGRTGVYPPYDTPFAKAVRSNLDALSDEELDARIAKHEANPPDWSKIMNENHLAMYRGEKRRREEEKSRRGKCPFCHNREPADGQQVCGVCLDLFDKAEEANEFILELQTLLETPSGRNYVFDQLAKAIGVEELTMKLEKACAPRSITQP